MDERCATKLHHNIICCAETELPVIVVVLAALFDSSSAEMDASNT